MFTDSIQGILLFDSIEFKRMNNTFRFGLNPQFNLKNNFLLDFGMSFTMPLFKHIQMNQFSAGIGYNIKIHENFHIKPLVVL